MTKAIVVQCDQDSSMSKFAVVVAPPCQMGLYIQPGIGSVNEVTVHVYIESGLLQASLALGF